MKKLIERTLGNSLRCILPSYWWKRLLNKMADRIESANSAASKAYTIAILAGTEAADKQNKLYSGENIKTINGQSILGSGNLEIKAEAQSAENFIFYLNSASGELADDHKAQNAQMFEKYKYAISLFPVVSVVHYYTTEAGRRIAESCISIQTCRRIDIGYEECITVICFINGAFYTSIILPTGETIIDSMPISMK